MSLARATLTLGQSPCRRAILRKFALSVVDGQRQHYSACMCCRLTARRLLTTASSRRLSHSARALQDVGAQANKSGPGEDSQPVSYHGPLTHTFRRLKIFSLATLGLTFTVAPFFFIVESSLPVSARIILAATAVSTSSISTALVGWCGAPYVVDLHRLPPAENGGVEGVEMTTLTLTLKKLTTRVYDADFLVETNRPFAKWELPLAVQLPPAEEDIIAAEKAGIPGEEETIAETLNDKGDVVGRWIVKWGEGGTGSCQGTGRVLRYFNVHEELL